MHKIYRNGRLFDTLDPLTHAVKQIAASYAGSDPGIEYTVCDGQDIQYYACTCRVKETLTPDAPAAVPPARFEGFAAKLRRGGTERADVLSTCADYVRCLARELGIRLSSLRPYASDEQLLAVIYGVPLYAADLKRADIVDIRQILRERLIDTAVVPPVVFSLEDLRPIQALVAHQVAMHTTYKENHAKIAAGTSDWLDELLAGGTPRDTVPSQEVSRTWLAKLDKAEALLAKINTAIARQSTLPETSKS